MKTTPTYDRPGWTYVLAGICMAGREPLYLWRRSCLRVAVLCVAAGVVAGLWVVGCCN